MKQYLEANSRPAVFFKDPDCPVEIYQVQWEFNKLLEIYRNLNPNRVLEIGSMFGGSLWYWMQSKPDRLISIDKLVEVDDPNVKHSNHVSAHQTFYQWAADTKKTWFTLIEADSHAQSTVHNVANEVNENGMLDFLFIDGDHSYESAKQDFLNYGPFVRPGGIIVMHDILPSDSPEIKVNELWREIVDAGYIVQELYSSRDQKVSGGSFGIGLIYV